MKKVFILWDTWASPLKIVVIEAHLHFFFLFGYPSLMVRIQKGHIIGKKAYKYEKSDMPKDTQDCQLIEEPPFALLREQYLF